MGFGTDLRDAFQYFARKGTHVFYEMELSTKLQDSLLDLARRYPSFYHCEVIHGNRSNVQFEVQSPWVTGVRTGSTSEKELADIMFVVYSAAKQMIRLCFVQCKRADRAITEKFSADLLQLDLLHNRSVFKEETSGSENTILSDSEEVSVALYGVFYENGDTYDMDIYAAVGLKPYTPSGSSEVRVVEFEPCLAAKTSASAYRDEIEIRGLERFGTALEDCLIGRVIKLDDVKNVDILRGLTEVPSCPKILKGTLEDAIRLLEDKISTSYDNGKGKENAVLNLCVSDQVFFLDADRTTIQEERHAKE